MVLQTPPMGWNSWNTFGENISDALIRETADAMAENGYLAAGYNYLVIDDCWAEKERGRDGRLVPDRKKFPDGIKAVADYVHSKGLKLGIYSCAGYLTCAEYPGSLDYEFIDAATFAEWGVDYLKYDFCNRPFSRAGDLLYKRMGVALANCGRDICFAACSWGKENTEDWVKCTGANTWRSTGDIFDTWASVRDIAYKQNTLQPKNGQGCFNDMDMLIVGMRGSGNVGITGCTDDEYRTHFSLWAMLGSPLMIGCDIRNADDATKSILLNRDIIALNQDRAARQPFNMGECDELPVWIKLLDNGDIAFGLFNFSDGENWPRFYFDWVGLDKVCGKALSIKELWSGKELGVFRHVYTDQIDAHSCKMYRARVVDAD